MLGRAMAGCAYSRSPTNLGNGRARAHYVCSRRELGLFGYFFSRLSLLFSFSLSLVWMDGWMACDFTSFSIEFTLYHGDGWVMDDCVQWNHVYD